jgi:hypothetical protein
VIIYPEQQGSLEWLVRRAGIVTASELDNILTPELKMRDGKMVQTYLTRKLAEKWFGGPLPGFNSIDMEFGKIREEEAIPWLELETGHPVTRVGFVTTDDGLFGCSPDGLIYEDGGLEVKCPAVHTHVGYLLGGVIPKEYLAQVHGSLYATKRQYWKFLSYARRFPPLIVSVEWDEEIQEKIDAAVGTFLKLFDAAWARLVEINGGAPVRQAIRQPEACVPGFDLIP